MNKIENYEDILALKEQKISEDKFLDYKKEISSKNKNDICKDICAFANSMGGYIIIGLSENKGKATIDEMLGVSSPDDVQLQLTQMVSARIEPKLNIHTFNIDIPKTEKSLVIIRVNQSLNSPHAIKDGDKRHFYYRTSAPNNQKYDVFELRHAFTKLDITKELKTFITDRRKIIKESTPFPEDMQGHDRYSHKEKEYKPRVILHISPVFDFDNHELIDFDRIDFFQRSWTTGDRPFNTKIVGFDKYTYSDDTHSIANVFRNGVVEVISLGRYNFIYSDDREKDTNQIVLANIRRNLLRHSKKVLEHVYEANNVDYPFLLSLLITDIPPNSIASFADYHPFRKKCYVDKTELNFIDIEIESKEELEDKINQLSNQLQNAFGCDNYFDFTKKDNGND